MTAVTALHPLERLRAVRTEEARDYRPLAEREHAIAQRSGRHRPPSYLLYPLLGWMRLNGEYWVPWAPPGPPRLATWAEHIRSAQR
jgi:hypothetical protein